MNKDLKNPGSSNPAPTLLVWSLIGIAVASAGVGVLKACEVLSMARTAEYGIIWNVGLNAAAWLIFGLAAGGLFWAIAWLLMQNYRLMENNRLATSLLAWAERNPFPASGGPAETPSGEASAARQADKESPADKNEPAIPLTSVDSYILRDIRDQLAEINANFLLTEDQLHLKRNRRQLELAEQLTAQIEQAIGVRDLIQAGQLLGRLRAEVPDDVRYAQLKEKIEQTHKQAQADEIQIATRRVEDLMAVGSFDKALASSEKLVLRHPSIRDAADLLERVRREATAFSGEQRKRLCGEIERHVEGRRWRQAVAAAQRLLQAYPDSGEAQLVNAQLPTMQANARLEDVRELRDKILDLIERRRFAEAAAMARDLIRQYHDTGAAEEFAKRLPKLDELARGPQQVAVK
ncbi:MAG: hypothetical protein HZA50_03250 [Planctomycetes bacterium]|nr:hypothetical protein [Planctomycetota bacterium]